MSGAFELQMLISDISNRGADKPKSNFYMLYPSQAAESVITTWKAISDKPSSIHEFNRTTQPIDISLKLARGNKRKNIDEHVKVLLQAGGNKWSLDPGSFESFLRENSGNLVLRRIDKVIARGRTHETWLKSFLETVGGTGSLVVMTANAPVSTCKNDLPGNQSTFGNFATADVASRFAFFVRQGEVAISKPARNPPQSRPKPPEPPR